MAPAINYSIKIICNILYILGRQKVVDNIATVLTPDVYCKVGHENEINRFRELLRLVFLLQFYNLVESSTAELTVLFHSFFQFFVCVLRRIVEHQIVIGAS